jgi:hypothetical protein
MAHASVVNAVQVIMVHVVSPAQQDTMVVRKCRVRNELFLLLFIPWSVLVFYSISA